MNQDHEQKSSLEAFELTSKVFDIVGYKIANDWKSFGRQIGFNDIDLEHIDSQTSLHEKAVYTLVKWKKKVGNPLWGQLKYELSLFERWDVIQCIENSPNVFTDQLCSLEKKNSIASIIPYGCIFMFELYDNETCTKVEFQLNHEHDNWRTIKNKKHDFEYYVTKKRNNKLFVKLENLIYENSLINFKFSFQDSNNSCFQKDVFITGNSKYELTYNELFIATPKLISENNLCSKMKTSNILDWTENKVLPGQSIELNPKDYICRNFGECKDIISFLPNCDNINITFVFSKFFDFLVKNNEGICAVLLGYRLRHHASLLKCNVNDFRNCEDKNRLTIFCSEYNLFLIARIVSSLDCIKLESENCLNDIILFVNVNKLLLEDKKLIILGIVVLPLVDRESLNKELFCHFSDKFNLDKNLFICKDDFEDENLEGWWRSHIAAYCEEKSDAQSNNEQLFIELIGITMMSMSLVDHSLPTMEPDAQKQIKSLILTAEQRNAINDKVRKKIITGGYGSGKSVVGKEIVKNIVAEMLENPFTLYYICCNHFTLFECEMKEFVENLEKTSNANIICENLYWLWKNMCEKENISEKNAIKNISLLTLLKYLVNTSNNVHFVLEELSEEYVNEKEAIQIKNLITSMPDDSFVVFIPESITKHRELIKNNKKCTLQKNCFHDDLIGMKVISLRNLMRFPECNKVAIDSAQETICKSKTVFNFPNEKVDNTLETNENFVLEENRKPQKRFSSQSKYYSTNDSNNEITNVMFEDCSCLIPTKEIKAKETIDALSHDFYDNDRDQMAKNLAESGNNENSLRKMETSYLFKSGNIGHAIKGEKPKVLYFPFHDIANKQSVKIMSVVLQSLKLSRKTVIICYNIKEAQSVSYAIDVMKNYKAVPYLPHLRKFNPTLDQKLLIKKELKSHKDILITDSKGFAGAEAESVIVIVSPEEVYLRHALVDAMARSTFCLIIFALASNINPSNTDRTMGTIGNVLSHLFEVVESIKITVCDNGDPMWRLTDNSLVINKGCKEFSDLGNKIDFDKYKEKPEFHDFKKNDSVYKEQANQQSDDGMVWEEFEKEVKIRNTKTAQKILHNNWFKLKLSESLNAYWKTLGSHLGIEETYLDSIDMENAKSEAKSYRMITKWTLMNKNPTTKELKTDLKEMNRMDLVRKADKLSRKALYCAITCLSVILLLICFLSLGLQCMVYGNDGKMVLFDKMNTSINGMSGLLIEKPKSTVPVKKVSEYFYAAEKISILQKFIEWNQREYEADKNKKHLNSLNKGRTKSLELSLSENSDFRFQKWIYSNTVVI